jgi:hypothetical protein
MKYENWDNMSPEKKFQAARWEAKAETNNATTKADLKNIISYLVKLIEDDECPACQTTMHPETASHSEKDIVESCIELMEDVHANMMEYMEMMEVEHTEGIPTLTYNYFQIVKRLLLGRTRHGGGTSTTAKCRQLGIDPYGEIIIGESEEG